MRSFDVFRFHNVDTGFAGNLFPHYSLDGTKLQSTAVKQRAGYRALYADAKLMTFPGIFG
jgi:hypothetical protein